MGSVQGQCCASSSWARPTSPSPRWPASWRRARGRGRLHPAAAARRARHGGEEVAGPPLRRAQRPARPRACDPEDARRRQRAFAAHRADVAVVVAYGLILPRPVLAAPREGCLNLHASALPRWRGAAPIQRAIMAGDAETAAAVMRMEAGLDTGPVCLHRARAHRPGHDGGRAARHPGRARRQPDGARARRAGAGRTRLHAAAGRRHHVRREDRQGRDPDRFHQARA